MENAFNAECTKDSTASFISIPATGEISAKKVNFLTWKPSTDVHILRQSIGTFIFDAMTKAAGENYRNIAFPAIGCGRHRC